MHEKMRIEFFGGTVLIDSSHAEVIGRLRQETVDGEAGERTAKVRTNEVLGVRCGCGLI